MSEWKNHDDDSSKWCYPPGVDHDTRVRVVIRYNGKEGEYESIASQFGWMIEPHHCPGLEPVYAGIVRYKVLE